MRKNILERSYVVPGTRRKFTGLKIAGVAAGGLAVLYIGSRLIKKR